MPSAWRLKAYALDGEYPVSYDEQALGRCSYSVVGGAFLSHAKVMRNANDSFMFRSLIRHDGEAVAVELEKIAEIRGDRD
jgi:hypothetical protein